MIKDALSAITEFHRLGGQPIGAPLETDATLRIRLLEEEVQELADALDEEGLTSETRRIEVADALGDIVYVAIGAAVTWGIPLDRVFAAIHKSNMTKVEHGVVRRPNGKIMKGPHYVPPDIRGALEEPAETYKVYGPIEGVRAPLEIVAAVLEREVRVGVYALTLDQAKTLVGHLERGIRAIEEGR